MKISLIQPSRNNLKYLKWSYASIRKHQGNHTVELCVADDASSDGTWVVVGETKSSGAGNVYVYRKFNDGNNAVATTLASGNGVQSTFPLAYTPTSLYSLRVSVEGNVQAPGVDYTLSSSNIVFDGSSIPVSGANNISITQSLEYYELIQTIADPDGGTGANFGYNPILVGVSGI